MSYNNQKPDAGPSPALDAPTIQGNFSSYADIFSDNHVAMKDQAKGNHSNIVFEAQPKDPGVNTALTVLYAKNALSQAGTQPELFVQIPKFLPTALDTNNKPNVPMRLSYSSVGTTGPPFYSFLPGGYVLYWGIDTGTINAGITKTDTITITPAPTAILIAIAVPNTQIMIGPAPLSTGLLLSTTIVNNTTFTIKMMNPTTVNAVNYIFNWLVIGTA